MYPAVTGLRCEPSMPVIRPSCTVTSRLQESGQSSGQTVSTVCSGEKSSVVFMKAEVQFSHDSPRGDSGRWVWRVDGHQGAPAPASSGHPARSAQLSPVSAAVVPGGDSDAL